MNSDDFAKESSGSSSPGDSASPCDEVIEKFIGLLDNVEKKKQLVSEFCNSHPECAEEIRATFEQQQRLDSIAGTEDYDQLPREPVTTLPESFGDFRQVHWIAEGGMGIIYKARQESLQRWVAIKTLSNPAARARFENEQQCLAQFNLATIVPLYETGEWNGMPYLVMPFIEGATLNKVVIRANRQLLQEGSRGVSSTLGDLARASQDDRDAARSGQNQTSVSAKLGTNYLHSVVRCVIDIARAIQESHNLEIVHRDLKPENVMVNTRGRAFIIDFGLASPLDSRDAGATTLASGEGLAQLIASGVLGTPAYMAPEQFDGKYTTATDVWGIGTILYELIAFARAFKNANRENPPKRPRNINSGVPRDLDAITMKCLAPDAGDRYQSADAVAEDLERWMQHVPVVARPPGIAERLGKWSRRHPALTATAVFVLIGLTGLFAYSRQQAKVNTQLSEKQGELERAIERVGEEKEESERQRNKAVELAESNKTLAEQEASARRQLQDEFLRAQQNLEMARQAVDELTRTATRLPVGPKLDPEQRRLFETSLGFYREFLKQGKGVAPEIQFKAAVHFGLVARRQHDALECVTAEENFQQAVELLRELVESNATVPKYRETLAGTYLNLANLLADTQRTEKAEKAYQQSLDLFASLVEVHPNDPRYVEKLAGFYNNRGELLREASKFEEAEEALRAAIRLQDQLPKTNSEYRLMAATTLTNLALTLQAVKRSDDAEALYGEALVRLQQLSPTDQQNRDARQELARCYHNRGNMWLDNRQPAEALRDLDRAIVLLRVLIEQFPTRVDYERELARAENSKAAALADSGDAKNAVLAFQGSIAIRNSLVTRFPESGELRRELADAYFNLGITLEKTDQVGDAAIAFRHGQEHFRVLVNNVPTPEHRRQLADVSNSLANVSARLGRLDDAERAYQQAVSILRELVAKLPERIDFRHELARTLYNFAAILQDTKRSEAAESNFNEAIEILSKLMAEDEQNHLFVHELASAYGNRALLFVTTGQPGPAKDDWEKSRPLLEQLVERHPDDINYRRSLALTLQNLGGWYADARQCTRAVELIDASIEQHREVLKSAQFVPKRYLTNLHSACLKRAQIQIELKDYRGALTSAEELPKVIPDQWPPYRFAAGVVASCIPLINSDDSLDKVKRQELAEDYAQHAVALLQSAMRAGFKDVQTLRDAADMAPLRNYDRFLELCQGKS